jgi:small-conductance mechanosensitive channel/CRP-like cAMP-binding protein
MNDLAAALWREETPVIVGSALVLVLILLWAPATRRSALLHALLFFAVWLLLDGLAAVFALGRHDAIAHGLYQAALLLQGVVLIRLAGLVLFRVLLPALHLSTPRILEDIVVIGAYLLWGMVRLTHAGVELSSLVATSAVITAVLAFAMQDTLGNILGGLALQLDNSLEIGDWVKLDDLSGRVVEIQWRFTAILTRNGEKVVIPNAHLMKSKFLVLCPRDLGISGWRRWIWFDIDYAVAPSQVVAAAERSVLDADIPNVAQAPPPTCVAMAFGAGSVRYALRYWLIDPRDDDPTDSAVRIHLLATIQRNGWRIALPDQAVHLVRDDEAHRAANRQHEIDRRVAALGGVEVFAALDAAERRKLAERLVPAPFARGDVMTRQGAVAHWLYIIVQGEAEVYWETPTGERRALTRLGPGNVFGEMGLMTGAPRSATVVAHSDVECYRLDKAAFEDIIHQRHEIAEHIAQILAQRQQESADTKAQMQREASDATHHRHAMLGHIRSFFGLA